MWIRLRLSNVSCVLLIDTVSTSKLSKTSGEQARLSHLVIMDKIVSILLKVRWLLYSFFMSRLQDCLPAPSKLMPFDAPQAQANRHQTRSECHPIRASVAIQSIRTVTVSFGTNGRVLVIDATVDEVEEVAKDHRSQNHHSPILGKSMNAEGLCDKRRKDTEKKTVGNCSISLGPANNDRTYIQ